MMTPILDAAPGSLEQLYTKKQMLTRTLIEHCNGVLKCRFRCLLKHRVLHYNPAAAARIIKSCTVLHNMCIHDRVPHPPYNDARYRHFDYGLYLPEQEDVVNAGRRDPDLIKGLQFRAELIRRMFGHL